jgi:putative endonuclease
VSRLKSPGARQKKDLWVKATFGLRQRRSTACAIDTSAAPLYSSSLGSLNILRLFILLSGARNLHRKTLSFLPVTHAFRTKRWTLFSFSAGTAENHLGNGEGTASLDRGAHSIRTDRKRRANRLGGLAERVAAILLRLKGYRNLAYRFRVRGGEIDIIARRGDTVAFIEVKVRPTLGEARTAIGETKRRRISRAARVWLAANPWSAPLAWRGDAIFAAPGCWPRHEIGAIELDIG